MCESFTLADALGLDAFLVATQGILDLRKHVIRHMDVFQNLAQFLGNFFFAKIWGVAFTPVAAATVVDVLPLLQLCCHRAIVFSACKQPAKGEVMLPALTLISTA